MSNVRARMFVSQVARQAGDTSTVSLRVVSRGTENASWSKFTPSGQVELTLTRLASPAFAFFNENVGKEVYVDFTLADIPVCTQCGEPAQNGTGIHSGNVEGYVPDEWVHSECMAAAKERLGIA